VARSPARPVRPQAPRTHPPRETHREHDPSAADALAAALRAGRYGDAVETCATSPRLLAQSALACTLAACHTHDAGKAQRWIALAPPGKQAEMVTACRAAGTSVETAAAKPDCNSDPMACRR
jgi:hypothetical protein